VDVGHAVPLDEWEDLGASDARVQHNPRSREPEALQARTGQRQVVGDREDVEQAVAVTHVAHRQGEPGVELVVVVRPRDQLRDAGGASRELEHRRVVGVDHDGGVTPAPPGLVRPDTDSLPDPVPLSGGGGQLRRAVVYAAAPGPRPLELDLYAPGAAAPVIVFLHGGGWRLGTRAVFCPTWRHWSPDPFQRLVAAGFAVASVDYRLSGEAVFPAQLHDVRAAARWLHTRAAELGVDAARIVVWGESAGGHLAALLGLTAEAPDVACGEPGDPGSRVAGVVDWYGAADLLILPDQALPDAVASADAPDSRESLLLGAPIPKDSWPRPWPSLAASPHDRRLGAEGGQI
jgi:acetyl esterase/lipase